MIGGLSTAQLRVGNRPRLVSKVTKTATPGVSKASAKAVATNPESIVDYLKFKEENRSFKNRKEITELHNIKNYAGNVVKNEQLLNSVKKNGIYPKKSSTG